MKPWLTLPARGLPAFWVCLLLTLPHAFGQRPQTIAHRGASGLAPENTLAAFEKAIGMGVDYIELDVHLSQDDSLIVMHDHRVDRTTDGEGDIENLTYAYMAGLDAGSWFSPAFAGERVPTLYQVLRRVNGRTKVLIELKWPASGIYSGLVERVLQTVRACGAQSWVSIQSFETRYLVELYRTAPEIHTQQLIVGRFGALSVTRQAVAGDFVPVRGVRSVNPSVRFLSRRFIDDMHGLGLTVYPYTINEPKKMARALRMGVDGIITNRPDVLLKVVKGQ